MLIILLSINTIVLLFIGLAFALFGANAPSRLYGVTSCALGMSNLLYMITSVV